MRPYLQLSTLPAMEDTISKLLENSARLVQEGRLEQALQGLSRILQRDPVNKQALSAIAVIYFLGGQITEKNKQYLDAYEMYIKAITFNGDLLPCREKLLSLIPRYLELREADRPGLFVNGANLPGRLVLGIGTGRSGSTSFTKLLSLQPGTYASHEHPPHLPWIPDQERFRFHVRRFGMLLSMLPCVADASHWWLPYLEDLLREFPDTRVVSLKRDRDEVIRSFESILGPEGGGQNHWVDHQGKGWQRNRWDQCFPKYPADSRPQAIGLYWDEYYSRVDALSEKYPDNLLQCNINELNNVERQSGILQFCGYDKPVTTSRIVYNERTTLDSTGIY